MGLAVALIVSWLCSAGTRQFEAIYLDELGAGESLIGLATTLAALVEIPAMLWADRLVNRWGSPALLRAGYGVSALLMGGVLLWPGIPIILAARGLGGIAFSFFAVGSVMFIQGQVPEGHRATALALYTVTLRNLVAMAAAPLAGMVYDAWGAYWLYAVAMAGGLLSWSILGIVGRYARPEKA